MISLNKKVSIINSFSIEECRKPNEDQTGKNYINKLRPCCVRKYIAIGTENGKVFIYDVKKHQITKCLKAEPWVSSIENCRGLIWTSGISRSLLCIRIKDNKKVFHTNTNTEFHSYNNKGVQILQEKILRFFFYNSSNSKLRIMNSPDRKKIIKFDLIAGFEKSVDLKGKRIYDFRVDDQRNNIFFTYDRKPELYVYSYVERKMKQVIKTYSEQQEKNGKVILKFTCGNYASSGTLCVLVSFLNESNVRINVFSFYDLVPTEEGYSYKRKYRRILKEIKGKVTNLSYFRNYPPGNMFTVIDDLGYVYLYKATDTEFFFIESLKHLSNQITDMISARHMLIVSSPEGDVTIFKVA